MEKRTEISKQIDKAFYWLDKLYVNGAAVEILAMARHELRAAQAMCREEPDEATKDKED